LDDVDFFTIDFIDDGLNADAFLADTGANGVNAGLIGVDGNFGAGSGLAGDGFDFYGTGVDFGDFAGEEELDELGVGAGEDDFIAFGGFVDAFDVEGHALVELVILGRDLFFGGHDGFGFAQVDDDIGAGETENHAGGKLANTLNVFGDDGGLFGFADFLENDIFGGLSCDATKARRGAVLFLVFLTSGPAEDAGFTGSGVKVGGEFIVFFDFLTGFGEFFFVGGENGGLDAFDDGLNGDTALGGKLIEGGSEFGAGDEFGHDFYKFEIRISKSETNSNILNSNVLNKDNLLDFGCKFAGDSSLRIYKDDMVCSSE
jgi:hypothetical protein